MLVLSYPTQESIFYDGEVLLDLGASLLKVSPCNVLADGATFRFQGPTAINPSLRSTIFSHTRNKYIVIIIIFLPRQICCGLS